MMFGRKASVMTISSKDALEKQQAGGVIIDVREDYEWAPKHIKAAVHIPLGAVANRLPQLCPDKNTPLIFYCAAGARAGRAADAAVKLGYAEVYNLGGIGNWAFEFERG